MGGSVLWCFPQTGKISVDRAREYYTRCVKFAKANIANLDFAAQEREYKELARIQEASRKKICKEDREYKMWPRVLKWLEQYSKAAQTRFKFLIIDGESNIGKSEYAKSLAKDPKKAKLVNCKRCPEPPISGLNSMNTEVLILDEATAKMVADNRKVMQACNDFVHLGCSATNVHSYLVFLHEVKIVVTSNSFWAEFWELDASDRDWILKNSFYFYFDSRKLYWT